MATINRLCRGTTRRESWRRKVESSRLPALPEGHVWRIGSEFGSISLEIAYDFTTEIHRQIISNVRSRKAMDLPVETHSGHIGTEGVVRSKPNTGSFFVDTYDTLVTTTKHSFKSKGWSQFEQVGKRLITDEDVIGLAEDILKRLKAEEDRMAIYKTNRSRVGLYPPRSLN